MNLQKCDNDSIVNRVEKQKQCLWYKIVLANLQGKKSIRCFITNDIYKQAIDSFKIEGFIFKVSSISKKIVVISWSDVSKQLYEKLLAKEQEYGISHIVLEDRYTNVLLRCYEYNKRRGKKKSYISISICKPISKYRLKIITQQFKQRFAKDGIRINCSPRGFFHLEYLICIKWDK